MSQDSLTTLLREVQHEVQRHQYTPALKIIRDAKIIDLHNLYLSAIEHFVATMLTPASAELTAERAVDDEQVLSLLVERAVYDREKRSLKRAEGAAVPDERLVMLEKVKNGYFQRADEFIEAKEFGRAMEEIQRVYFFDPQNFVAKEYQQKIAQLADLNRK
ncbi:MAG: hypothetical protein ACOYNS_11605 [Bacteroidota bacterium]